MSFANCTQISAACPVEATTYGYVPNLTANAVLLVVFGLCGILQLSLGIYYRAWSFTTALAIGCFMELVGYVGRLQMHANVWGPSGFQVQIVCLILAPSFIAAGVYLSLKYIIMFLGPEHSRIPPKFYTWIFITFDVLSIAVQAIGGGLAGAAGNNLSLLNTGNNLMIGGIAIQVVTMAACGLLAIDFVIRYRRSNSQRRAVSYENDTGRLHIAQLRKAHTFMVVEIFAYIFIIIRCIYR